MSSLSYVAKKMSNGRWFVMEEGNVPPAITNDPTFGMGLTEDRARELAELATAKSARQRADQAWGMVSVPQR